MSSTTNKNINTATNHKVDSSQSTISSNKQSIPQLQSTNNQPHHSQQNQHISHIPSQLPLQQHNQPHKSHGKPLR